MNKEDWKVKFYLGECDDMYDKGLHSGENTEVRMPYIPSVGDVVWLPERCYEELESHVAKCWEENKCENCPYMYYARKSVNDINAGDYIWVHDRVFNVREKEVLISLKDSPKE